MPVPRSIRARVLLGSVVTVVIALAIVAATVPLALSFFAAAFAVLVVAFIGAYIVQDNIAQPLQALTQRADAQPAPDASFDVQGPEEVMRLAAALRRAWAAVRSEHELAQEGRDRLATLIDELGEAVFIANDDGRIALANAAARALAGSDSVGRHLAQIVREH